MEAGVTSQSYKGSIGIEIPTSLYFGITVLFIIVRCSCIL